MDNTFIKRWQLVCEEDITYIKVMLNVTRVKIDKFIKELVECNDAHRRMQPVREDGLLTKLQCSS